MPNPANLFERYDRAIRTLGVKHVFKLEVNGRREATEEANLRVLDDATGLFFTGGDQIKITSQIGDTSVLVALQELL